MLYRFDLRSRKYFSLSIFFLSREKKALGFLLLANMKIFTQINSETWLDDSSLLGFTVENFFLLSRSQTRTVIISVILYAVCM